MDKSKTTMSVTEMRRVLGLGKTDSYWLVHKQCFETIMVAGKCGSIPGCGFKRMILKRGTRPKQGTAQSQIANVMLSLRNHP